MDTMGNDLLAAGGAPAIGFTLIVALLLALPVLAIGRRTLTARLLACVANLSSHSAAETLATISHSSERLRTAIMLVVMALSLPVFRLTFPTDAPAITASPESYIASPQLFIAPATLPTLQSFFTMWHVIGVSAAGVFFILLLQRQLYAWVHNTFFSAQQMTRWNAAWHLTTRLTSAATLVCALLACSARIPPIALTFFATFIVLLVKSPLLQCAWNSFFGKKSSLLHYFSYLCAVEIVPLFAAWSFVGATIRIMSL